PPNKEEARPPPEGASCDPGPPSSAPATPLSPMDTRIVMGEETQSPLAPHELRGGPTVPCPFPSSSSPSSSSPTTTKDNPPLHHLHHQHLSRAPPPQNLDHEVFFTAPSTPIRVVGPSRLLPPPPPPPEEDGESEGLCSPPTSPSGSYMTAEGGSWGSSGTASTSPSCSPNLVAEAVAEEDDDDYDDDDGGILEDHTMMDTHPMMKARAILEAHSTLEKMEPPDDEDDDGPFVPPPDVDDDDGETPEDEDDDEEWEVSEDTGMIPAALLPFRGSLLFQAEAVEIAPLSSTLANLPVEGEDGDDEDEEEEGGSTSASFLHSLSETSITEGVDESFAFHDDTSASSDSAAYDGEEDEKIYGMEHHALGTEGGPSTTTTRTFQGGGIELHLHS
ncbi:NACAD protein, partial [Turnix velox]|nr:NACAD protein [Turnix velox]